MPVNFNSIGYLPHGVRVLCTYSSTALPGRIMASSFHAAWRLLQVLPASWGAGWSSNSRALSDVDAAVVVDEPEPVKMQDLAGTWIKVRLFFLARFKGFSLSISKLLRRSAQQCLPLFVDRFPSSQHVGVFNAQKQHLLQLR